ncbi:MAG: winged helix-turn-helix domain-containing protein [Hydrogenophaga sp.]|jgi:molybdate transport system regulatory protein|uniref:winged helix-turn-helix domain-containing protein n=1 Tax=unclassified Hydrogenophaga TaxID=2610897 RepID=UPI0036D260DA
MKPQVQFRLRIKRGDVIAIGPGKVSLLEAIARTGSISAAGRELNMSYRRAWLLVDEINRSLTGPAVSTAAGGAKGGGTSLTPVGEELVRRYRAIEAIALAAASAELQQLTRLIAP